MLWKNIPNILSGIRVLFSPLIILLAYCNNWLGAFVLAASLLLSDWLDGFLAGKLKAFSRTGKIIDPLGDTSLAACSLWGLVITGHISLKSFWLMVVIFILVNAGLLVSRKDNKYHLLCSSLSPHYYLWTMFILVAYYAHRALGTGAFYLLLPAAILLAIAAFTNRHRLKGLFNGHWH